MLGLGNVGRAVAERLVDEGWRRLVAERGYEPPELVAVGVRQPGRRRGIDLPESIDLSDDLAGLVARDDIEVVVELLGGLEPAGSLIRSALAAGRSVVTANKALIASGGAELEALTRQSGAVLRFEAAVGGGIPILAPLVRDLAANRITSVTGILNGTTNHILTAMTRDGADYASALATAQRLGYAEADPTADVEGHDAVAKLVILVRLAFGPWLAPGSVARTGISAVSPAEIAQAAARDEALKLLCRAHRATDGTVTASVAPTSVARGSAIGATDGVTNIIEIEAHPVGTVAFRGPGAGGPATASAVLADVLAISRGDGSSWASVPNGVGVGG